MTIALTPRGGDAYCNRSQAYYKLGDRQKAIADLTKGLELGPSGDVKQEAEALLKKIQ